VQSDFDIVNQVNFRNKIMLTSSVFRPRMFQHSTAAGEALPKPPGRIQGKGSEKTGDEGKKSEKEQRKYGEEREYG